uniref:Integrase family protein n=1 Tax=Rhodopseudomonas palustris (strain DX-1) TaxID=652103 RepID=E6VQ51_RHOPX
MAKILTDKAVAKLQPKAKTYHYADPELRGHYVRIQPSGTKTFAAIGRKPDGKQQWVTIGAADALGIAEARKQAQAVLTRIRAGMPAFEAPVESFENVARDWLKRHAAAKRLRTEKAITRLLESHVFEFWKDRPFLSIRRSDVTALLDDVEDDHGARSADRVLTIVRSIMNWQATRSDDYQPPIVKGMRRQEPAERVRTRILTDAELREVWNQAEVSGTFGSFVRIALLTAQRRAKVLTMRWENVGDDGKWTIPQEHREKASAQELMLPPRALDIIRAQPHLGDNPFVFASARTDGPINGFANMKRDFDARLSGVGHWTIHDLRRTARSLMSRAGVPREHAERTLGHVIAGVEGIYDQHKYFDEKAEVLRKLAALIDVIVQPHSSVRPTKEAKQQ